MYKGRAKELLDQSNASVGDTVRIRKTEPKLPYGTGKGNEELVGILLDRPDSVEGESIVIKLKNGYNTGINISSIIGVELVSKDSEIKQESRRISNGRNLPKIALLSTGGTIASQVDYRTGAVHPAISPDDFLSFVPELSNICDIESKIVSSILSEDITPSHWTLIAKEVVKAFNEGARGVIIAHGTDTLAYTSAALSFLLRGLPGPVVMVGSQRSSDRPSSDSSMNLHHAALVAATTDLAEVCVVMHASSSDKASLVHRGTRVRKMHSSRRDAFQSINSIPLGYVKDGCALLMEGYRKRDPNEELRIEGGFEDRVFLLNAQPSLDGELVRTIGKMNRAIIISGTGLGHVNSRLIPYLRDLIRDGKPVVMATSCINGRTDMKVYSTGRDLIEAGLIDAGGMTPETAMVKAMWCLSLLAETNRAGNGPFKELFLREVAGEFGGSTPYHAYGREYYEALRTWGID